MSFNTLENFKQLTADCLFKIDNGTQGECHTLMTDFARAYIKIDTSASGMVIADSYYDFVVRKYQERLESGR